MDGSRRGGGVMGVVIGGRCWFMCEELSHSTVHVCFMVEYFGALQTY